MVFWTAWVLGFTFIQSFGKPYQAYFGWFSYYVLTLPIFVAHTYLVAYLLIPKLLTNRRWPLFVLLFFGLLYGFSVLELLLSNEFIFRWYPTGTRLQENYLEPGNVFISGLGNLYIVLVFLAARTIRNWYLANNQKKRLEQEKLQQQIEETISKVQPWMLIYAIDQIEKMVERGDPGVTEAIALTSELLNEIMMYHRERNPLFTMEVGMVRKLMELVSLFRADRPEVDIFLSGDPGQIRFPSMLLFSFMDMVIREYDPLGSLPEISIEASGFSNMITIQVLNGDQSLDHETAEVFRRIIQRLESLYGSDVDISWEKHSYGFSLTMNTVDRIRGAVHLAEIPAG